MPGKVNPLLETNLNCPFNQRHRCNCNLDGSTNDFERKFKLFLTELRSSQGEWHRICRHYSSKFGIAQLQPGRLNAFLYVDLLFAGFE